MAPTREHRVVKAVVFYFLVHTVTEESFTSILNVSAVNKKLSICSGLFMGHIFVITKWKNLSGI